MAEEEKTKRQGGEKENGCFTQGAIRSRRTFRPSDQALEPKDEEVYLWRA
jgi:hypothetical protein